MTFPRRPLSDRRRRPHRSFSFLSVLRQWPAGRLTAGSLWSDRTFVQRAMILAGAAGVGFLLGAFRFPPLGELKADLWVPEGAAPRLSTDLAQQVLASPGFWVNGRPRLYPLPAAKEVWECEVIVVGGSLGGVAAASHAMKSGAKTCLIEAAPWLGGQISSQGVSAIDESSPMILAGNLSPSWQAFKEIISRQMVDVTDGRGKTLTRTVREVNSCWVGTLCFPPRAGARAAQEALELAAQNAPGSHWSAAIAFKGAKFDASGRNLEAIYAVRRIPKRRDYAPLGRLSKELDSWYAWSSDDTFEKIPLRLQAPKGKRPIVIDATDTGELIAWARVPHRLGSESRRTTGEVNAAKWDNPECTQATTFPFVLAIAEDGGRSQAAIDRHQPTYPRQEHENFFTLKGFPMVEGPRSIFKYRRIVSLHHDDRFDGDPSPGDLSLINWSRGNNWNLMNPPLILSSDRLLAAGQFQNWRGGLSTEALGHAEDRALLFSAWLMRTQASPGFPLSHVSGAAGPMGTISGLSMMPYIREGRRIWGHAAYSQPAFLMREQDVRWDLPASRPIERTAIAVTHYDIDIQGCNYRNWEDPGEATKASVDGYHIKPVTIPYEAIVPRGVENLLMGGKAIAVTHIVNGITRIHYSEWSIGSAAGVAAAWLARQHPGLDPAAVIGRGLLGELRQRLHAQGLRWDWGPGPQPKELELRGKAARQPKPEPGLPPLEDPLRDRLPVPDPAKVDRTIRELQLPTPSPSPSVAAPVSPSPVRPSPQRSPRPLGASPVPTGRSPRPTGASPVPTGQSPRPAGALRPERSPRPALPVPGSPRATIAPASPLPVPVAPPASERPASP